MYLCNHFKESLFRMKIFMDKMKCILKPATNIEGASRMHLFITEKCWGRYNTPSAARTQSSGSVDPASQQILFFFSQSQV